jgi:predicted MPP superfamily phosphohydrolase
MFAKVPFNQVFQLTVDHKRLAIPQLSAHHEGLKIAHISDLHITGRIGPKWYEVVAEQVNQLQADVIVITGDLVEKEACWPWLAGSLGKLQAKHGVYFVLGNHDFYVDANHTRRLLQKQGLTCLSGRWIETEWNGASVILAGNERPWGPQVADLAAMPEKNTQQLPLKLMLLHTPDQFTWACNQEADLAFAGHTHGGQLRFPLLGPIVCPSRFGTRYACGVFRRGNTVMHVTRGISGKTPIRWNCPPEIALLELVPG